MADLRLLNISKPVRYIDDKHPIKVKSDKYLNFCLIFPDIYEIGSSHVGYRLLYDLVNQSDIIYCQRFFAPWKDALEYFGADIFCSMEENLPLKNFDVLGFSLQYEMCYTTVLAILKYSGIKLHSSERTYDPLIIAGGSCAYNPAPLSPFIDAFYIGEGDVHLRNILEGIKKLKDEGCSRHEILKYLNEFPFMYVPQIEPNKSVIRDIYSEFPTSEGCKNPYVPLMPAIQDRVAVEIARGCTAGCRFCQAGVIYRPVRERSIKHIINDVLSQIDYTGHQEVALLSLSTGDYSQLESLFSYLNNRLSPDNISLATPSLRANSVSENMFQELSKVRKSGFTIAPEAGSERMRRIINKNLSENDILRAVTLASNNGYKGVKLYFMIGLPWETDNDILAIADIALKIKKIVKRNFNISISVSNFVPKPHTPFQVFGQVRKSELERRKFMLKDELKRLKFNCKFHDVRMSLLEAVMSRGGKEISSVLEYALNNGFYLDSWDDFFDYDSWVNAFESCGLNIEDCASKSYDNIKDTPWYNIKTGISDLFMEDELKKAENEASTSDCRFGRCSGCGVCDFKTIKTERASEIDIPLQYDNFQKNVEYFKYELIYKKEGSGIFLSALELNRVFCLALRSSGVKLKFSEGFNPLARIVLMLPLPVGIEGENERLFFECERLNMTEFISVLSRNLPKGIIAKNIKFAHTLKLGSDFISSYYLGSNEADILKKSISDNDAFYIKKSKDGSEKKINLNSYITKFSEDTITLKFNASGGFNLAEFFKQKGITPENMKISRISVLKAGENHNE